MQRNRVVNVLVINLLLALLFFGAASRPLASAAQGQGIPATPDETPLAPLLLSVADAPAGMAIAETGSRSAADIAATFPDPTDAAQQLQTWGWEANVYRTFVAGPDAPESTPRRLEISLFRFAWPAGAAWALPYFAHGRAVKMGQTEGPAALLRPDETAVLGPGEATRYVRVGTLLVRATATFPSGADASALALSAATTAAEAVLARGDL
ncbi:MAG TPA: hypothetical protein VFI22_09735, partial [Thermomicrobiales bacterium]|nr:hypothetical protein [Thermomicrobiales bacterium]